MQYVLYFWEKGKGWIEGNMRHLGTFSSTLFQDGEIQQKRLFIQFTLNGMCPLFVCKIIHIFLNSLSDLILQKVHIRK